VDEDDKEALKGIVNKLNRNIEMPPYDNHRSEEGYSRVYQKYKEEEAEEKKRSLYEEMCLKAGSVLRIESSEGVRRKLAPALNLLGWEVSPGMVLSASIGVGFASFLIWIMFFGLNMVLGLLPFSIMMMTVAVPVIAGFYTFYKPIFEAKNKAIQSSGEMILSILYMVVYVRSTPNLEGAIRFAALNLNGPISKDLKGVLWEVEVGNYNSVSDALHDYTKIWKDYNEDYLQSLQMVEAAMNDPNSDRRNEMLQDSIDSILESTQQKMKRYAKNLKMPVMVLNALGAMLPVLAMIILPLITAFMGAVVSDIHLIFMFNVMLPLGLYWFMQRLLSSRPPTTATKTTKGDLPPRGRFKFNVMGKDIYIRTWIIGALVFLIFSFYGLAGYLSFPHFYPVGNQTDISAAPAIIQGENGLSPFPMLLRSVAITYGLGIAIGVSKVLGNKERKKAEEELESIEQQFPQALFQLGNNIAGGTPIEVALKESAEDTDQLEISGLFDKTSKNVRSMGMTFEQALFNPTHGALKKYPSKMIETVMKAVLKSSQKGTKMAAMAMMTISRYLENIQQTQETLNDLLEDTTSTITMLAYLLAPVVSGVAVGMSQTITTAMYQISEQFAEVDSMQGQGQSSFMSSGLGTNIEGIIPPEVLQFVVGLYLIQLLHILGTFYVKITHGENPTYKNLYIGKLLIVGMTFYTIVLVAISLIFGGLISSIGAGI